jgi:hypothetical protein
MLLYLVVAIAYTGLIFKYALLHPAPTSAFNFLPSWLVFTTVVIPYLYVWYAGFRSVSQIFFYRQHVEGILYKSFLKYLALGFGFVVGTSIVLQFLSGVSSLLTNVSLGPLVAIVYALLIIIASGYVLIARGAKKLEKIEEI